VGTNGVIAITGGLTLPVGGLALLLASFAPPALLRRVGLLLVLEAGAIAAMLCLGTLALADPALVPSVPSPDSPSALALLALGVTVFALLAVRAVRTFLLTRRFADLAVGVGLVWLLTAVVPALTMTYADLGWWLGHEFELDGILVVGAIVAVDLARATQSRPLAGDFRAAELVRAEELFLGSNVRALTRCLAEKDEYTERHARRVALLAVQCGELLGLSTRRLRMLAIGSLVHDIGKLSVPDLILKKPGPLDDGEYAAVQRHPEAGGRLLQELGGFPRPCGGSSATTTSDSTAPAIRAGSRPTRSTWRRGSSPRVTSTTRSSPPGSIGPRGLMSRPSPCFAARFGFRRTLCRFARAGVAQTVGGGGIDRRRSARRPSVADRKRRAPPCRD
jgi:HD domain-containing protein